MPIFYNYAVEFSKKFLAKKEKKKQTENATFAKKCYKW